MLAKIIFVFLFIKSFSSIYPIFDKIKKSKKGVTKLTYPKSLEEYNNYIKNNNYVFSFFHSYECTECDEFSKLFDEASKYKIINKKWIFLKIDCTEHNDACQYSDIQQYPIYEIYRKNELLYIELPQDLIPMLAILYKLSTESIIKIKSKEEYFKKYGYYSPIVEIKKNLENNKIQEKVKYDENEDNYYNKEEKDTINKSENSFIGCIEKIAKNDFLKIFYFGIIESEDNKEKIVFDNGNYPITFLWDGICQNAINFLNKNKYPLLTKVDKYYLKELDDDLEPHILISIMTFPKKTQINDFIFSYFKKFAFNNRKYIFGYVDYNEDKDVFNDSVKIILNNTNEIQLIINNFEYRSFYLHKPIFNIANQSENEIIDKINNLLLNITNLQFETGSIFQDIINFIGFNKMNSTKQIIIIFIIVLICLGLAYRFGDENDYLDDDLYGYDEIEEVDKSVKSKNVKIKNNPKVINIL